MCVDFVAHEHEKIHFLQGFNQTFVDAGFSYYALLYIGNRNIVLLSDNYYSLNLTLFPFIIVIYTVYL